MNKSKSQGRALEVLRILRAIPATSESDGLRQQELHRQDSLIEKAVSLVLKTSATADARAALRTRLREALDQHLERLEDEAQHGQFRDVARALWEIHGAASRLLGSLNRAPLAALNRLRDVSGGESGPYRLVEWEGVYGRDMPLGMDREIFEQNPPDGRKSPSGLVRRLAALEALAKLAADSVEAEAGTSDAKGAKSIRQARTGRTPELDLFEDCTRILGPIKMLARLTIVAGLLHEAATGDAMSPSWGRDHETRARRWWRAVGPFVGLPLSRVPETLRELVAQGLVGIELPNRRGVKVRPTSPRKGVSKNKASRRSGMK